MLLWQRLVLVLAPLLELELELELELLWERLVLVLVQPGQLRHRSREQR